MTVPSEQFHSEFWIRLAGCVNEQLRNLRDNHLRFLWVDDIVVESAELSKQVDGIAYVPENSGKSFETYSISLLLSDQTVESIRAGEVIKSLPGLDSEGWLTVSRNDRVLVVNCN